jgi:hypothetical protein
MIPYVPTAQQKESVVVAAGYRGWSLQITEVIDGDDVSEVEAKLVPELPDNRAAEDEMLRSL